MFDERPNLPPWTTAELAAHATDAVGEDQPNYGVPLELAIRGTGWSWLEYAVIAGHVPHFEGVLLALRGIHAWWMDEITQADASGALGDALGWASQADAYREAIALLEGFVAEMEEKAAQLHTAPTGNGEALDATEEEEARQAQRRASRACDRKSSALEDNASAGRLRSRNLGPPATSP